METVECDVLVVGGGPAGLSAAINGASEGFSVRIIDGGDKLGGQARTSAAIENYAGYDRGVSGDELMARMVRQALRLGARVHAPHYAVQLTLDKKRRVVLTSDFKEFAGKMVILAMGLDYRRHDACGIGELLGRGVHYGWPGYLDWKKGRTVAVVGAANSAGQAICRLAGDPRNHVKVFARRTLEDGMSAYLIDRIRKMENVEVVENTDVSHVHGRKRLEKVKLKHRAGGEQDVDVDHLLFFIGATPNTSWLLKSDVALTQKRYVSTGGDHFASEFGTNRAPLPFETTIPWVFCAGDVRDATIKRIAFAVGDGSGALAMCHQYAGDAR